MPVMLDAADVRFAGEVAEGALPAAAFCGKLEAYEDLS